MRKEELRDTFTISALHHVMNFKRRKPRNYNIRIIHFCILIAIILTLPSFIMIGLNYPLFELQQLIFNFILCLTTIYMSVYIIKMADEKRSGMVTLLVIGLYFIVANILLLHDAILTKANEILAPEKSIREWIMRTNMFTGFMPLYKRCIMLALHTALFSGLLFYIVKSEADKERKSMALSELDKIKNENLETQLQLLKQQISPHFLFNSLNTLRCIAPDDKTKSYITQLSNVYRYLLTKKGYKDEDLVYLKEELEFTNSYLYILKERFEDALDVETKIDEETLYTRIPPLALQVLIENATKHNIVSLDEPLHIDIHNEGKEWLVVRNNLQLKSSSEESFGIGLENIKKRYQLLSEKEIEIIRNEEEFTVKIPLIKRENDD